MKKYILSLFQNPFALIISTGSQPSHKAPAGTTRLKAALRSSLPFALILRLNSELKAALRSSLPFALSLSKGRAINEQKIFLEEHELKSLILCTVFSLYFLLYSIVRDPSTGSGRTEGVNLSGRLFVNQLAKFSLLSFLCISSLSSASSFIYHDFDEAMQIRNYPKAFALTNRILNYDGAQFYTFGKLLYNQYNPALLIAQAEPTIPKHIHQIWIGGPLPDVFKKYMDTWKAMHPDWKYTLWTDENVRELFPLYNQKFYDESEGMGVKSDLLKWEIIYRFGGVYVDVDYECLHPLDELHYRYDFYTAFQPLDAFFVQLGAALYAAHPHHPILKHCIETIKDDWHHKGAPKKSGPCHFSKSFMAVAGREGKRDIAFPAFYFYPLGSQERELKRAQWKSDGAYAIHHWAKSWMPISSRRKEFQTFDNERSSEVWNG